jgi:hypothetical protein
MQLRQAQRGLGWALLVAAVAACGSGYSTEKFCQDEAARDQRCGNTAGSASACQADVECRRKLFRPGIMDPLLTCLANRACGVPDETCFAQVTSGVPASAARTSYQQACTAKAPQCTSTELPPGYCSDLGEFPGKYLTDPLYQQLTPCFSHPCAEVRGCLQGVPRQYCPEY